MTTKEFYKRFENTEQEKRLALIKIVEPTSLFVIFQQLSQIRVQMRYFQEREERLLKLAEEGFKQLYG